MNSDITIRPAQVSDSFELHKLNDLFNGEGCNSIDNIKESLRVNTQEIIFIAENEKKLVGFCCGHLLKSMCYPVSYAEITELFVMDEFRRQGIGKRLLNSMEAWLADRGAHHFHILTFKNNTSAQALYKLCGYVVTSEILLEKNL